jgi:hypothetical protein
MHQDYAEADALVSAWEYVWAVRRASIVLGLTLVVASTWTMPADAGRGLPVEVGDAKLKALANNLAVSIRCARDSASCRGTIELWRKSARYATSSFHVRPRHRQYVGILLRKRADVVVGETVRVVVRMAGFPPRTSRPRVRREVACDNGRTLLADAVTRVFQAVDHRGYFVCWHGDPEPLFLSGGDEIYDPIVLHFMRAGKFLAFERICCVREGSSRVDLWDLGKRRRVRSAPSGQTGRELADGSYDSASVNDIALRANGAVAWIAVFDAAEPPYDPVPEVHTLSSMGRAGVIDGGRDIDPSSLDLSGSTLSWLKAGARRTAELP